LSLWNLASPDNAREKTHAAIATPCVDRVKWENAHLHGTDAGKTLFLRHNHRPAEAGCRSALRENMKLTPEQRLEKHRSFAEFLEQLRNLGR
jgi:hypothetical protein